MAKVRFSKTKAPYITNLRDIVESSAKRFGEKPLYYYKEHREIKAFTYSDNERCVNELGSALIHLGLNEKKIAIIGDAHPNYMTVYYATVCCGGTIVPLDKELEEEQIVNFMNRAQVSALFYTERFNGHAMEMAKQVPSLQLLVPLNSDPETIGSDLQITFSDLLAKGKQILDSGDETFLEYPLDMDKMSALLFTSGTTGTSKGVMLSHKNLVAATNASLHSTAYDSNNTFVSVLPMNHSYEVTCSHLASTCLGTTTFLNDSLKNVMQNFKKFAPNTLILVPLFVETMHKKIWNEIQKKNMEKKVRFGMKLCAALLKVGIDIRDRTFASIQAPFGGNLTSIVCGGAPVNPQIVHDFHLWGIEVMEGYGITECAPLVAVNRPYKVRYHSVGQPVERCLVRIDVPDGKGNPEETGEILVKGDNVMLGYFEDPDTTKEVFAEDGWFRTGDLGYMDKDNYIYITGRKKNLILGSNGKNIFPEEIEEHLAVCNLIGECVVVGRTRENDNLVLTAVIYPNPDLIADEWSTEEITKQIKAQITEVNKHLPVYKQVREIELRTTPFEKTTSKKIKRFLVK